MKNATDNMPRDFIIVMIIALLMSLILGAISHFATSADETEPHSRATSHHNNSVVAPDVAALIPLPQCGLNPSSRSVVCVTRCGVGVRAWSATRAPLLEGSISQPGGTA